MPGWALSAEPDATPRVRAAAGLDALTWTTVGLTGGLAAYLTVGSLGWPLVHDGPLMHYVAARLLEGAAPYRDLFDMNWPGVYLAHALALVVLGRGDGAFRAFDLAILAGTTAGLVAALRPFGRRGAAAAVALFWLYHLAGGAWRAGQRDLLLCLPLAGLAGAALADAARPRRWTLGLAAGALGVAVWIKPHAALLIPLVAWLAWRRPPAERGAAATVAGLGLALPGALRARLARRGRGAARPSWTSWAATSCRSTAGSAASRCSGPLPAITTACRPSPRWGSGRSPAPSPSPGPTGVIPGSSSWEPAWSTASFTSRSRGRAGSTISTRWPCSRARSGARGSTPPGRPGGMD